MLPHLKVHSVGMVRLYEKAWSLFISCLVAFCCNSSGSFVDGFSMPKSRSKTIYGIPNSGWTSPSWNWGSASGTGHDCAKICRQTYSTKEERLNLINSLISNDEIAAATDFEEVKLVMALAWQNGRRDGSDGGVGGYGDVLSMMADAKRYEENVEDGKTLLFRDMQERFHLLDPNNEDEIIMKKLLDVNIDNSDSNDIDTTLRCCSGLVLKAMGFIQNG
jgi:hypothetical protein